MRCLELAQLIAPRSRLIFSRYTQLGLPRLLTNHAVMGALTLPLRKDWEVYDHWLADSRVEVLFQNRPAWRPHSGMRWRPSPAGLRRSGWATAIYLLMRNIVARRLPHSTKLSSIWPGSNIVLQLCPAESSTVFPPAVRSRPYTATLPDGRGSERGRVIRCDRTATVGDRCHTHPRHQLKQFHPPLCHKSDRIPTGTLLT